MAEHYDDCLFEGFVSVSDSVNWPSGEKNDKGYADCLIEGPFWQFRLGEVVVWMSTEG